MFECKTCKAHASEIQFLRERISDLTDRLLAVSHPHALAAIRSQPENLNDYYGSSENDQIQAFDEFGQITSIERVKANDK